MPSPSPDQLPAAHYVDLVDGRFNQTSSVDLDTLFENLDGDPHSNHLVIHFHGGLVSRKSAHRSGSVLFQTYRAANTYPIFFVWNSDLLHALGANLDEIAKEKAFRRLVVRVAQFVLGNFAEANLPPGARSATGELDLPSLKNLPKEDLKALEVELTAREAQLKPSPQALDPLSDTQATQAERELERDAVLREEAQKIANGLRDPMQVDAELGSRGAAPVLGSTHTLMSAHVLREIAKETQEPAARGVTTLITLARYGVRIIRAVLRRYRQGRDHGLYTTVVQEVLRALYLDNAGIIAWNMMKQDTRDAFGGNVEIHGGTAFLHRLRTSWPDDRRVTLVGHSTGAIYIGHFLEQADQVLDASKQFDVVFLAAACSFPFLHKRIDIFRRRVANIRAFGLADNVERGYWEVPAVFKGSLLYIVSGLLEEDEADLPLVGMERYFNASGPYDRVDIRDVAAYIRPAARVWAGYQNDLGPGRRSEAKKHGDFDDKDAATRDSLAHLLRSGF